MSWFSFDSVDEQRVHDIKYKITKPEVRKMNLVEEFYLVLYAIADRLEKENERKGSLKPSIDRWFEGDKVAFEKMQDVRIIKYTGYNVAEQRLKGLLEKAYKLLHGDMPDGIQHMNNLLNDFYDVLEHISLSIPYELKMFREEKYWGLPDEILRVQMYNAQHSF